MQRQDVASGPQSTPAGLELNEMDGVGSQTLELSEMVAIEVKI